VVLVTAALHGDEINGVGAVRSLIGDEALRLRRGALILVPVVNVLAFDRHSRYLPDRRDLNRCFPGSAHGSLASRMAHAVFHELVSRADMGIDLHTAAVRRTNFPNVRAELQRPETRRLARAFGAAFTIDGAGPKGAFRREACRAGCPMILFEGGEVWKVEPAIVEVALRGIRNVLIRHGMVEGEPSEPPFRRTIEKTTWVRAERGGFLRFHVSPGDIVQEGEALATNTSLLGRERRVIHAPFDAAVLGMTTLPAVSPGEPVCHLGRLDRGARRLEEIQAGLPDDHPLDRAKEDLSSSVMVEAPGED
jgi:predicted deacylase